MPTRTLEFGIPGLLGMLSPRLRGAVEAAEVPVRYRDGVLIQARGDATPGLSVVRGGAVRIGNIGADGAHLTTAVLGLGQTFGEMTLFADLPRTFDARAYGPTTIGHINKTRFDRLLQAHPELAKPLLRSLSTQLHAALEFIDDLRRLPLIVRVAKVLATMVNTSKNTIVLETTQAALADTIGVTRVSVANTLAELEREGLVRRGYGAIEIPDVKGLLSWVEQSSQLTPVD